MGRFRRHGLLGGLVIALVLVTTACSGGGSEKEQAQEGGGGKAADNPRWKFAMVTHAPDGDVFWNTIIKGAEDAAAKDNVDFQYSNDIDVTQQASFVQAAIDAKVDGIAVTIPNLEALKPVIKSAADAGIPVMAFNAGDRNWQETGALSFFGEPEVLAGEFAGKYLADSALKNALCVIQAQGQQQLEDRCDGMEKTLAGGKVTRLFADGTDTAAYVSTVTAKLKQDPSIDAVVTLGPALGVAVANEVKGGKVKVATYAMTDEVYPLLESGDLLFTIDQQPYLQGYMSIDALWLYKRNGNVLGANQSIPTGPLVIDKTNAAEVAKLAKAGTR